jgi:ABC-type multidrug transport system permease subunit
MYRHLDWILFWFLVFVGVFVNCLLNCMMGQSTVALTVLAQERPLFLREYVTKTYSIGSFVLVKLLVELFDTFVSLMIQCLMIYYIVELKMNFFAFFGISMLTSLSATSLASFLGFSVKDTQFALALFPMVILPQFYFSGVLVPLSFIPGWLRWMQYLCSLWYALALCLIYEFEECDEFEKPYCDALLERQQIDKDDKEGVYCWGIFLTIIVGFKFMSTLLIRAKAQY